MPDTDLPCLDMLEATPEILRGLLSEIYDDDARWKPAPDRFSIAEILAHLAHSEGDCYRMRIDRFMAEDFPSFEADDAQMYLALYRNADPEDAFDRFEEQREIIWNTCGTCRQAQAIAKPTTRKSARLPSPRCCTNGRYMTSATFVRLPNSCAPENIWQAPAPSGTPTS